MEEGKTPCMGDTPSYSTLASTGASMVAEQVEERKRSAKLPPFGHAPITFSLQWPLGPVAFMGPEWRNFIR